MWEAKAIVALADHRKKYPDWRFKPAANALAKVKDGPRKRGNRKGRRQTEMEGRRSEKRCAKIADLLVAGKTGSDLAAAVELYDCETGRGRRPKDGGAGAGAIAGVELPQVQSEGDGRLLPAVAEDVKAGPVVGQPVPNAPTLAIATDGLDVKPLAPRSAIDGRFKVPLTAMFKRSSSAPAPRARTPTGEASPFLNHRRDSFSAAPSSFSRATSFDASEPMRQEIAAVGFGSAAAPCKGIGHAFTDSVSSIQSFNSDVAAPLDLPRNALDGVTDVSPSRSHIASYARLHSVALPFFNFFLRRSAPWIHSGSLQAPSRAPISPPSSLIRMRRVARSNPPSTLPSSSAGVRNPTSAVRRASRTCWAKRTRLRRPPRLIPPWRAGPGAPFPNWLCRRSAPRSRGFTITWTAPSLPAS